jgi:phage terminase small subunit
MAIQAKIDKEDRFVNEYLVDLNATAAYRRSHPGCADNTAATEGGKLLGKPEIQARITEAKIERSRRTHVTQDKVIKELSRIGFSDITHFVKWGEDGTIGVSLIPAAALGLGKSRAVSEISNTEYGIKIKLHNKVRALEILLEHVKASNEDAASSEPLNFAELAKKATSK